jgi:hypothetical protein
MIRKAEEHVLGGLIPRVLSRSGSIFLATKASLKQKANSASRQNLRHRGRLAQKAEFMPSA